MGTSKTRKRYFNTFHNKSNNPSLSVNEIYSSRPINTLDLTKNSKSLELTCGATYVNQTFSLDGFKTDQKETLETTYEMAQDNWDETHKDINNIYNHLENSAQSHKDKNDTYSDMENSNKKHCDTNNTY